jgi:hypothetical protein
MSFNASTEQYVWEHMQWLTSQARLPLSDDPDLVRRAVPANRVAVLCDFGWGGCGETVPWSAILFDPRRRGWADTRVRTASTQAPGYRCEIPRLLVNNSTSGSRRRCDRLLRPLRTPN